MNKNDLASSGPSGYDTAQGLGLDTGETLFISTVAATPINGGKGLQDRHHRNNSPLPCLDSFLWPYSLMMAPYRAFIALPYPIDAGIKLHGR